MNIYEILSPSGRENQMAEYIKEEVTKIGCLVKTDTFGNLVCGEGEIAVECGMDTLCFMKTAETDNGMIKIAVPNSNAVKSLIGKRVQFLNGVFGVVRSGKTDEIEDFDLSVDIGALDKESAKNAVPTGEFGAVVCDKLETEEFIFGNGVSSYVLIEILLDVMKEARDKATFIFTSSKKTGGRGLKALLSGYDAKTLISLNAINEKGEIKCGKGTAVVIKEKGAIPDVNIRQQLINSAKGEAQLAVSEENLYLDLPQICGNGARSGGVCLPVRDKGGAYEGVSKRDIESTKQLLINFLEQVD